VHLARNNPTCAITSVDLSAESIAEARRRVGARGLENVTFLQADLDELPFGPATFDHLFVCFVLEHLREPAAALRRLAGQLVPGGTLTVVEGDHDSFFCHPTSPAVDAAVAALVELQRRAGGDATIGRRLHPLLVEAGYSSVAVEPVPIYADPSLPELASGFTRATFRAMVAGVEAEALAAGLVSPAAWTEALRLLGEAADRGTAFYAFFRGTAARG
jgi:SAM-dependent methyltransferase